MRLRISILAIDTDARVSGKWDAAACLGGRLLMLRWVSIGGLASPHASGQQQQADSEQDINAWLG